MAEQKKRPGRPRKDPRGTQRQLKHEAYLKKLAIQEGERARVEKARRTVNRAVRDVFSENPWISKVIAGMFVQSIEKSLAARTNLAPKELGEFISEAFSQTLAECATFDGLSRAMQVPASSAPSASSMQPATAPTLSSASLNSIPSVMAAAATPDLSSFANETLGDLDDEDDMSVDDLPPISDEDAAVMGFLPEA